MPNVFGQTTPFSQYIEPRRNALMGAAAGFLSPNFSSLGTSTMQGMALDRQYAEDAEKKAKDAEMRARYAETLNGWGGEYADLAEGVAAGGLDPADAYMTAWQRRYAPAEDNSTANQNDFLFARSNGYEGSFEDWVNSGGSGGGQLGTTIYTGRDANGNIVPMQVGQGGFVPSSLPDGVTFEPGALNAERAAGTVEGKAAGQASIDLPGAIQEAQRVAIQIEDLKTHPGLDAIFGKTFGIIPNQWGPTFPGTDKANAMARIEQMSGNAFLNGRQLLKGGGAITDMESNKAEAAFARLSQAQTKEEFIAGLDEFNAALAAGIQKLSTQTQATQFTGGGQQQAPGGPRTTSTGVSYTVGQ